MKRFKVDVDDWGNIFSLFSASIKTSDIARLVMICDIKNYRAEKQVAQ